MRWALLAGGGASRGAVQVGPLERLHAAHGPPAVAVGTSIGATTVSTDAATLRRAWGRVTGTHTFQRCRLDVWRGLYDLAPLRDLHDDYRTCRRLPPTWVGCYDLARHRYRLVALHDLDDVADRRDAVLCSSAIPLIHQPRELQGRALADGGVSSVLGRLPRSVDTDTLDAVHVLACSPVRPGQRRRIRADGEVSEVWEQAVVCYEAWQTQVAERDLAYLRSLARQVPVYLWAPTSWEQVGDPFDASPERIASRLALGEALQPVQVLPTGELREVDVMGSPAPRAGSRIPTRGAP